MKYRYIFKIKSNGKNWNGERIFYTLQEAEEEILPVLHRKYEDAPNKIKFKSHKWTYTAYGNIEYVVYRLKFEE